MIFIEVFNYSLVFVAGGLTGYYLLISLLALRKNRNIEHEAVKIRKFAVILFAQEKEQIFSRSLYSLFGLVYPKNKYDLIVIADSYSDSIVQVAEKMGAKIMVPPIDKRDENKNIIFPWVFDSILQEGETYDAVVIFDSDGLVSGNYLEVMNYYLDQGSEVVQCSYNNLRSPESWIDKISEVDFLINRFVYPMGRKVLGLGINLLSNGICFSTALLREFPWEIEKHPSSVEYGFDLRLNGIEIDFAPNAVVFTRVPPANRDRNSNSGNLNTNSYQLLRKYAPRLLSTVVKKKSFKHFDVLFGLVSPQLASLMLFVASMGGMNAVLWGLGWISSSVLLLWLTIIGIAISSISVALAAAVTEQKFLKSIMYIPITIYIKVQGFIQEYRREEQAIIAPDEEDNRFAVPDENQTVQ